MAYIAYLGCGFEAGVRAFYIENGWDNDFGGTVSTAGLVHKTLSGSGGSYSFYVWTRTRSPVVSTNSRWLHFWETSTGATDLIVQFGKGGARQFTVYSNYLTGVVTLYNGGTPVASSATNAWNYLLPHWVAVHLNAATAGSCTVFIDGVQVVTYSGDTAEQATDNWDQFSFGNYWGGFPGASFYIDDILVTDDDGGAMTTPLPEVYGFPVVPDGVVSGNLTGVPITGSSRYQNIDDLPASQTDYNLAAAANDEDLYSLAAPPASASVKAVVVWAEAGRDGTVTQAAIHTVSGASDTYGTAETLPAAPSYGAISRVHTRNPDGDVAWDATSLGALQVGLKFT